MQDETKINPEQFPDVEKQNWDVEKISQESTNKPSDEIVREMLRGDETEGNPNDRDIAGSIDPKDTPHGREETKK